MFLVVKLEEEVILLKPGSILTLLQVPVQCIPLSYQTSHDACVSRDHLTLKLVEDLVMTGKYLALKQCQMIPYGCLTHTHTHTHTYASIECLVVKQGVYL